MKLRDEMVKAVLGIRGSGKSHHVKHKIVRPAQRVVVWDPHDEYGEICGLDEVTIQELDVEIEERKRVCVVPYWDDPDELVWAFRGFVTALKNTPMAEQTLVVIEEAGLLRQSGDGALIALAAQSRHWRMPLVIISQRATMQAPGARSQWTDIVSFRQSDPADIDALAERIGETKAREISRLPRREFVTWSESEAFDETTDGEALATGSNPPEAPAPKTK